MARSYSFDLDPGSKLGAAYRVEEFLGAGWEGEVYRVVEVPTGVTRAAKLFYPERNPRNRTVKRYARMLERLRSCPMIIHYHHTERLDWEGRRLTCLVSEFVDGLPLPALVRERPGRRLENFEALHLLHALAEGLECIHAAGLYHGDLHAENILARRQGLAFDLKVFDFFHHGRPSRQARQDDVIGAIQVFHECLGGTRRYASHPPGIKAICRGLRHGLLRERFPTARRLRVHLESLDWSRL
jgi:serine/threonine protein kinase